MEEQDQICQLWWTRESICVVKQPHNCFILVGLLDDLITPISKQKGSLETCTYISQTYITVTSNSPVISSSLFISLFFISMLRTNSISLQSKFWQWSTVESEVRNISDLCGTIIVTGKTYGKTSRNYICIIKLTKERYFYIFPVSVVNVLLNKSRASFSDISIIPIYLL